MYKAFVYRLYPSDSQARRLESVRETCRRFWNKCLAERKEAWERDGVTITRFQQQRRIKVEKAENPFAEKVHTHILAGVVADLDRAFQAFFRRVKAGETPGYPRFKSRDGRRPCLGFGYSEYRNGFRLDGGRLKMWGIGRVPVHLHRPLEGRIKTARLRLRAGKWYVAFVCAVEPAAPLPSAGREIGIDLGLHRLATLSTGEAIENPRWYRRAQRKLRTLHRAVHRKQPGGSRRRKAVARLQRFHARLANVRQDCLVKLASRLVREFDLIALEDLNVSGMARGHFAKSILDAGWSYFVARLRQMGAAAGRTVVLVDPAGTSKTCSGCGAIFKDLTLSDRWIDCEACGLSLDRDHNAAINILKRGKESLASSGPGGGLRASSSP